MKLFSIKKFRITFFASFFLLLSLGLALSNVFRASAESEEDNLAESSELHYVTIYDAGFKRTIKTSATTVAEAINLVGVILSEYDSVEPKLDSVINADNFFINVYRAHPAIVIDGSSTTRTMTSSYDPEAIAAEAGFIIYDGDEINLIPNSNFLETGAAAVYQITRGDGATLTIDEEIAFSEQIIKDYTIATGETIVEQYGEVGSKRLVYNIQRVDGKEVSRELVSETIIREPVARVVRVGVEFIPQTPLTASKGRNRYTVTKSDGTIIERQETYYDLDMSLVMQYRLKDGCGDGTYNVREDGVKIDSEGYVIVAANLDLYPLCSVVETSLGLGKVYDTGSFATKNPEQFDIATDWTKKNGR